MQRNASLNAFIELYARPIMKSGAGPEMNQMEVRERPECYLVALG
jgi:hypothetical protein